MQNIQTLLMQGWHLTMWYDRVTKRHSALLHNDGPHGIVAHGSTVADVMLKLDRRASKKLEVAI